MLKTILGLNPLREGDLSDAALMRLRISSIFAILITPIITVSDYLFHLKVLSPTLKLMFIVMGLICITPFAFSRVSSLFIRPKKDLDEWEIAARKDAESFTYRVLGLIFVLIFLYLAISDIRHGLELISLSGHHALYLIGNILLLALFLPAAYIAWTQKPLDES